MNSASWSRAPAALKLFLTPAARARSVDGVKRITHVAVGEKHSLALQHWAAAPLPPSAAAAAAAAAAAVAAEDKADAGPDGWLLSPRSDAPDLAPGGAGAAGARGAAYWALREAAAQGRSGSRCAAAAFVQCARLSCWYSVAARLQGPAELSAWTYACRGWHGASHGDNQVGVLGRMPAVRG